MAAPTKPAVYWRPAPFAIYAPDPRRALAEHALALCCLLVFAAAFLPRPAGRDAALRVPVAYHRLQFAQRAPALIALNLPAGDYTVDPQSLGYFTPAGEFIYTAAVARGLIYGRSGGEAFILELAAPEDSRAFLGYHLDQIRAGVLEQNRLANLLAQARAPAGGTPGQLDRAVAKAYQAFGAQALNATPEQAAKLARAAQAQPAEAQAALERYTQHQAVLKQRYYACQRARLDVLGQQAALQLALARLPDPPGTELLSLGDDALVAGTLERELAGIEQAWRTRLRTVQDELAARGTADTPAPQADGRDQSASSTMGGVLPPLPEERPGAALDELAQALRTAREAVLVAEARELTQSLKKLAQVRSAALTGRPPGWTNLPRLDFTPQRLAQPSLAALPGYSAVLGLEGEPAATLALLRQLARRFEDRAPAEGETAPALAQQGYPFELPYGLLAVDLAERAASRGLAQGPAEAPPQAPAGLLPGLQAMLDHPDSYGLAALDLAYLHCLCWYARQEQASQLQAGAAALAGQAGAGVASVPAAAVRGEDGNRGLPFD